MTRLEQNVPEQRRGHPVSADPHGLPPKQIVEVGSGYSSAVMLDSRGEATQLTFVEPFPSGCSD
jgi:hypothetical protein